MSSLNEDVQAAHSSGSQQSKSSKGSRGPRPRLFLKDHCQADDCSTPDLSKLRFYNRRNHVCLGHQKADHYSRRGQTVRFCQRCAVAHPLEEFDGAKRSCRQKLEIFNAKRRKNATTTSPQSPSSSIPSKSLSGFSSGVHDLDSIDLDFALGELLPVGEQFDLDFLLPEPEATPAPATAAVVEQPQPQVSAANSINCNERVCCNTMDAECICCQQLSDDATTSLSIPSAAPTAPVDDANDASTSNTAAVPTAADCDDSDACLPGPSSDVVLVEEDKVEELAEEAPATENAHITAAAAAAKLEAEFAALQATDAAMYAMIVHQQIMQARLLLTTTANALILQRARSVSGSPQFSRKESFGEISPMVM